MRTRRAWWGAVLSTALLAAACTDAAPDQGPPAAEQPTVSAPSDAPSTPAGERADPGPVTLSFAGDVHFEGVLRARLADPVGALGPVADRLGAADVTVVNLETSIGTSGAPEPKRYTFQAPPSALEALAGAGVDVVTMANNHGLDFGTRGLADTLEAADTARRSSPRLDVVGIGADAAAAFAPAVVEVRGTRVAVLGAAVPDDPTADPTAQWAATAEAGGVATALDPRPLLRAVRRARATADVVVVYLHWGVQGASCPSRSQTALAAALADPAAGADVVVGSHSHRLQGAGLLGDTYVAYGLGNFAWYAPGTEATSTTGVLTLTVDDGAVAREQWAPALIGADGLPVFASGVDVRRLAGDREALRGCAGLEPLR